VELLADRGRLGHRGDRLRPQSLGWGLVNLPSDARYARQPGAGPRTGAGLTAPPAPIVPCRPGQIGLSAAAPSPGSQVATVGVHVWPSSVTRRAAPRKCLEFLDELTNGLLTSGRVRPGRCRKHKSCCIRPESLPRLHTLSCRTAIAVGKSVSRRARASGTSITDSPVERARPSSSATLPTLWFRRRRHMRRTLEKDLTILLSETAPTQSADRDGALGPTSAGRGAVKLVVAFC